MRQKVARSLLTFIESQSRRDDIRASATIVYAVSIIHIHDLKLQVFGPNKIIQNCIIMG